mmetsp:Transcript_52847/g.121309  ORF Transcript_52847/g.121309 Transcript_52847/m.121309 type:complete len:231 (-) Transcript_52847:698-1390(-)
MIFLQLQPLSSDQASCKSKCSSTLITRLRYAAPSRLCELRAPRAPSTLCALSRCGRSRFRSATESSRADTRCSSRWRRSSRLPRRSSPPAATSPTSVRSRRRSSRRGSASTCLRLAGVAHLPSSSGVALVFAQSRVSSDALRTSSCHRGQARRSSRALAPRCSSSTRCSCTRRCSSIPSTPRPAEPSTSPSRRAATHLPRRRAAAPLPLLPPSLSQQLLSPPDAPPLRRR